MVYLNNNSNNILYLTLSEACISASTEFLFSLYNETTKKSFYFITSAQTQNDRYDKINLTLTSGITNYYNSIPNQPYGQYLYDAYELNTGNTSGITINELTGNTINLITACTQNTIIETGKIFISGSTQTNEITKRYTGNTITYKSYK